MTDPTAPPDPSTSRPGSGVPYAPPVAGAPARTPILGILSLIAGIVGFVFGWIGVVPIVGPILAMPVPIAAVVLGFIARKKEDGPKGFWLAGIILGFVTIAFALIMLFVWIALIATAGLTYPGYYSG